MRRYLRPRQALSLALVVSASFLGCSHSKTESSGAPYNENLSAADQLNAGHPSTDVRTDSQVAGVVAAANKGEVEQGNAALPKLQNEAVKSFAQEMVSMHSAADKRAENMLRAKNIAPAESPASQKLTADSDEIVQDIREADADDVDKLYMKKQIDVHKHVLDLIDNTLLPNVQDPELRADLLNTRGAVESHLARARTIADGL